jgi:hypothetical protein
MQAALHPVAAGRRRFLFEDDARRADGKAALAALAASLVLHLPVLSLVGLWGEQPRERPPERNVTALFDALVEQDRIVPVDLESLGGVSPATTAVEIGPAPGAVSLADDPRARGGVSAEAPESALRRSAADVKIEACVTDADAGADAGRGADGSDFDLATRIAAPAEVVARSGGKGGGRSGLTREEERTMRARWFGWYRGVLSEKIHAAYPRARLEGQGVRGSLSFHLELAPDGSVRSLRVLRADARAMRDGLDEALDSIKRFPPYAATGLSFFPPFAFDIHHGPAEWSSPAGRQAGAPLCTVESGM